MKFTVLFAAVAFSSSAEAATINNKNIEIAAKMNVAENICDINFGTGPGSLVHFVMMAAAELRVTVDTAAQMADIRSREIMRYVVNNNRTAQFCANAKHGRL
jgi:hypothetical protein